MIFLKGQWRGRCLLQLLPKEHHCRSQLDRCQENQTILWLLMSHSRYSQLFPRVHPQSPGVHLEPPIRVAEVPAWCARPAPEPFVSVRPPAVSVGATVTDGCNAVPVVPIPKVNSCGGLLPFGICRCQKFKFLCPQMQERGEHEIHETTRSKNFKCHPNPEPQLQLPPVQHRVHIGGWEHLHPGMGAAKRCGLRNRLHLVKTSFICQKLGVPNTKLTDPTSFTSNIAKAVHFVSFCLRSVHQLRQHWQAREEELASTKALLLRQLFETAAKSHNLYNTDTDPLTMRRWHAKSINSNNNTEDYRTSDYCCNPKVAENHMASARHGQKLCASCWSSS